MDIASVPAVSIAVVEGGEVSWTRAVGFGNTDTKTAVDEQSVFAAASLGKPVFGYVVLRLVDEGKLSLDRPLVSYFRPDGLPSDPNVELVTAAHVLSHTTGFRNWRNRLDQKLIPDFVPGARFQYSGEGFFWLQQVVEAVTGQAVDRVMRDRLFGPAGMPRASYGWSRDHDRWFVYGHGYRGGLANQFNRTSGNRMLAVAERSGKPIAEWTTAEVFKAAAEVNPELPLLPNYVLPNVAGSLMCTAAEYGRFLTLLMGGRRPAAWEIRPASRDAILTPRVELKPGLSWGLGWGLERHRSGNLFWHWGDNGAYKAFTVGDPARRRAIAVFTNSEGGAKVYRPIVQAATGIDLGSFVWI
jgi:CubicO group peptidase (beta-lactamase class C family)